MKTPEIDTRLSHSSANLLRNCERKWWHYKVNGTQKDPDFDDNTEALAIGKSLHFIMEEGLYQKPDNVRLLIESCEEKYGLDPNRFDLVHAMAIKSWRMHEASGLSVVKCELEISDDHVIGFVDAVMEDGLNDGWWIVDLKTASRLSSTLLQRLPQDPQLNLYASYVPQIAEALGLDADKFLGCRYRCITKSTAKPRATETDAEYIRRLADLCKGYDLVIRAEYLDPEATKQRHDKLWERAQAIREGNTEPCQNFTYCDSYFRNCEYFSQCHGQTAEEARSVVEGEEY